MLLSMTGYGRAEGQLRETRLEIEPYVVDQELDLSVRYWEGAVKVAGTRWGAPAKGNGYVELVGYARATE